MPTNHTYKAKTFNLSGLNGISDQTLEMHFTLYEGYVKETNRLNEQIAELLDDGKIDPEETPAYSELKRRLGFETNGMVLHELYFENMKKDGGGEPEKASAFRSASEKSFGELARWKTDFTAVGKMRGIGWAICSLDPSRRVISNHWVSDHEIGHVAGFIPLLVMDMWEHAWLLDYKPAEKSKYIDAFMANVDWDVVESRLAKS